MAKATDKDAETVVEGAGDTPPDAVDAAARVAELRAQLEQAEADAASASGDMRATVSRDIPMLVCKVQGNVHVVHNGISYIGADYTNIHDVEPNTDTEFLIDGPSALALVMDGKITIERSATAEDIANMSPEEVPS